MNKILAVASVALLLSGCGETTEEICRKDDQQLRQATGEGFADVGWIGCLKQSPSEARLSFEATKKQLANDKGGTEPELMSHDEMTRFVTTQPPFDVIYKLGSPGSATFIPTDSDGKPIPTITNIGGAPIQGIVQLRYSTGPKVLTELRDRKILEDIQGKLAIHKDGTYFFLFDRPLTYGLFGLEDKNMTLLFDIKNGSVTNHSLGFPKHLWQSWFN